MILAAILSAATAAVVVSELVGRRRVVYTRFLGLFASYLLGCAGASALIVRWGGGPMEAAAIALSVVPLMAAWLGFRIHLTNSITLEMAGLMVDGRPRTPADLAQAYDVQGHAATRLAILRAGGYLSADEDERLVDSPRSRAVLLLMRVVCGPVGPRMVADSLRRLDARR